jgi:thiol-disulfide isomerase/thioredoxin
MRPFGFLVVALALVILCTSAGATGIGRTAPDFAEGGPWFNTGGKPLTLVDLKGKVVAVEMWTASCYNCLNVLPSLRQWDSGYHDKGLVIVGVHSPEFPHEHSVDYVRTSIVKLGIHYPVVMDNGFKIWRAYNNAYWPTIYLIDKKGIIRYLHIGEGAYDGTESMIRQLLEEKV